MGYPERGSQGRGNEVRDARWEVGTFRGGRDERVAPCGNPRGDCQREKGNPGALHAADASAYGSKTANLGEIVTAKVGVEVPRGVGIPISAYAAHLKAAGIDAKLTALLADPSFKASPVERKTALAAIRQSIIDAPLAPATLDRLCAAYTELLGDAGSAGVFVRSSTNAEELPGFSGAGLYDTVPNVHGLDRVAAAVKKVWASVWNLSAYEERELYRIDQAQVFGAVLVQIGVQATAAGVLVTAHPTDPTDMHTFTINAQSGLGIRVVDGKKLPEIVLYNTFNRGVRIVSRSDEDTRLAFDPDGAFASFRIRRRASRS